MKPIQYATFKNTPTDFIVTELLPIADELTKTGEHLWLYIKKTNLNTAHLVTLLAKWANIPAKNIGYSGLKDRHAQTYQWLSLYVSNSRPDLASFERFFETHLADGESVTLLKHSYHQKKLNRGTHKANHFNIILKNVITDPTLLQRTLDDIAKHGFPNFFGNQRFGRDGSNLDKAYQLFAKIKAGRFRPRHKDSLIISSARSYIFNEILAQRLSDDTWRTGLEGDVFNLDGTQSVFEAMLDDDIRHRLDVGDIHPTAPLFGKGGKQASRQALQIEESILNRPDIAPLVDGLMAITTGQRRALRAIPKNLSYQLNQDTLNLQFVLPTGSFATSLLDFMVVDLIDKSL